MPKKKKGRPERPTTTSESTGHPDSVMSQPISDPTLLQNNPIPSPSGLQSLAHLDGVIIDQEIELLEVISGYETENKYTIFDKFNHRIFHANEKSNCCSRQCYGGLRPFDMPISNMDGQEVIRLVRPLACGACCFPCCLQSLDVLSSQGALLGKVEQKWTLCSPEYVVKNEHGGEVLRIKGPCITCSCFGDVEFDVLTLDGQTKVGRISKKWSGVQRELLTDSDSFGIEFPMDLDVKMKAIMIGACMLIDFMYFEKSRSNKTN